jgi:putative tributyrin esterase
MTDFPNAQFYGPFPGDDTVYFLTLRSPGLGRRGDATIVLPENFQTEERLPILLLLHGVYGSHCDWWVRADLASTVRAMRASGELAPIAVVMPSDGLWGDGSGYLPHASDDYERWVLEDVPSCLKEFVPQLDLDRLFLGGLSMGGYGALRLGMKYAGRVRGISAHSSITRIEQMRMFVRDPIAAYLARGQEETDLLHWVEANRAALPPLRFDCGTGDALLDANRELHDELLRRGIEHTYQEFPGGHEWDYWKKHVRDTLVFVNKVLARPLLRSAPE